MTVDEAIAIAGEVADPYVGPTSWEQLQALRCLRSAYRAALDVMESQRREIEGLRRRDDALRYLLMNSVRVRSAFEETRHLSFQAPGMYDGAMSEECKAAFRKDHESVCLLLGVDQ